MNGLALVFLELTSFARLCLRELQHYHVYNHLGRKHIETAADTLSVLQCRRGAGPQGALSQLSQTMLGSGATFGLFMGVGSGSFKLLLTQVTVTEYFYQLPVIRTEGQYLEPAEMQAYRECLRANAAEAVRNRLRFRFQEQRMQSAVKA